MLQKKRVKLPLIVLSNMNNYGTNPKIANVFLFFSFAPYSCIYVHYF